MEISAVDEVEFAREPSVRAAAGPPPVEGPVAPVRPEERIESLDVLRGVALLGILIINIYHFGLPSPADVDPGAYGGAHGANLAVWLFNHVVFEGKMRAIFSMLFGASVVLLTSRAEKRGAGVEIADIYYRRTLWLAALGVMHAYLIWIGDILFHYAIVGLALFPLRRLPARTLCLMAAVVFTIHAAQALREGDRVRASIATVARYQSIEASGQTLSAKDEVALASATARIHRYRPDAQSTEEDIRTMRSGYLTSTAARAQNAAAMQSDRFYRFLIWDVAGMLILGMALMKLGVFDASRSLRFYNWMAIIGYGVGLPLNLALTTMWMRTQFDLIAMFTYVRVPLDAARLPVALGHVAVVMTICKTGLLPAARRALAKVGQMALSNYLLTSVLCTLFFYGHGLGMYARLQRYELLYVMATVWMINIALSVLWLSYFRFGPVEWIWRSLTYWKRQPMRTTTTQVALA
jgi:uncharacterized protein